MEWATACLLGYVVIWTTPNGCGIRQGSGRKGFTGLEAYEYYVHTPDIYVFIGYTRWFVGITGEEQSSPLPRCWIMP